jgi:hypothetical protein
MKKSLVLFFIVSFCFGFAGTASALGVEIIPESGEVYSYGYVDGDTPEITYDGNYRGEDANITSIDGFAVAKVAITNDDWNSSSQVDYISVTFNDKNDKNDKNEKFTVYSVKNVPIYIVNKLARNPNADVIAWSVSAASGPAIVPTPAPAAVWLLGTGLLGFIGIRRKMKK